MFCTTIAFFILSSHRGGAFLSGELVPKLPTRGENHFYVGNRPPLMPSPLERLPIQAIEPQGWLQSELTNEAHGFTGNLMHISSFLNPKNNAWLSPTGQGVNGWEEVPYWLRGYVDLAYVRRDPKMIAVAKKWVEPMIEGQESDGWFGPRSNKTLNNGAPDLWPNMLALQAFESYYLGSHDSRVLQLMKKYFQWELSVPKSQFVKSYWENMRVADNIASVYWLYDRLPRSEGGGKWMLALVKKLASNGADWSKGVINLHGVNFAQSFREPAEISFLNGNRSDLEATYSDLAAMRHIYGQVPGGMYGADENARPGMTDPRQATETCALVEMMMSDEYMLEKTGDPFWADHCEDVTFNDLPASMTSNEKALHYLTAPNMVELDHGNKAPGIQDGGPMLDYDPYDFRCCQHNSGMGWPKFAEHLWMATSDNGLAATLYAPSKVSARVGAGEWVMIREKTQYPFRSHLHFSIGLSRPGKFPLDFRIPDWCSHPSLFVNGHRASISGSGNWMVVSRVWKSGDFVDLHLPMKIQTKDWQGQKGAVSVKRGPLWYSLKIGEDFVVDGGTKNWPAYDVHPTTPWNYGLDLHKPMTFRKLPVDENKTLPFSEKAIPEVLTAYGRSIPQWKLDQYGLVATLQPSPALVESPVRKLTLIPMGFARLRLSVFPVVSDHHGTAWKMPRLPEPPIPAVASHCYGGDTVNALSDGIHPTSSDDQAKNRFTWWDHKGTTEWVEYKYSANHLLSSTSVYWFDDKPTGGECRVPQSWTVVVRHNHHWVPVHVTAGGYTTKLDRYNKVQFLPIKADRIRLVAKLKDGYSGGILQWNCPFAGG